MLAKIINYFRNNFFIIIVPIFIFFVAINFTDWAYDEYAAVFSHLELDDPRVISAYRELLLSKGIPLFIIDNFIIPLLSVFIVPIRWTYALGISPLYFFVRIDGISWEFTKIILHFAHSLTTFFGLYLISNSLSKELNKTLIILLSSFIILSSPFIYWSGTFTSYSYHIISFGLLAYLYTKKNKSCNLYFGSSSIVKSSIALFNYQYIFYLIVIGLIEIFSKKMNFFYRGFYKSWILPGAISLVSIIFTFSRIYFSGTEIAPTHNYPEANQQTLVLESDISGFLIFLETFFSRLLDIFIYFFSGTGRDYFILTDLNNLSLSKSLSFILFFFFMFYFILKKKRPNYRIDSLLKLCLIMICSQFFFYAFGLFPMSPSRHSLVLFSPFAFIFSVLIYIFFIEIVNSKKSLKLFAISFFCLSFIYSINHFSDLPKGTKSKNIVDCMVEDSYKTIILDKCFYEPMLQNKSNSKVKFLYSCGTYSVDMLDDKIDKVGFLSNNDVDLKYANKQLHEYSGLIWKQKTIDEANISSCFTEESLEQFQTEKAIKLFLFTK